jgi:hypothetical protein
MKTTLDIPDPLYKAAKIRAVELGTSLKSLLIRGLEREISATAEALIKDSPPSYWANRRLRPSFKAAWESGALAGGTDSTQILSEGREEK